MLPDLETCQIIHVHLMVDRVTQQTVIKEALNENEISFSSSLSHRTICRCGAVHGLLLLSPVRLLIQEGVRWLRSLGNADATVVTRCLISRQGSCLISMATAEADFTGKQLHIKVKAPLFFLSLFLERHCTWVCMAQRAEGGCRGPGGRSSWWVCLRVWPNCCRGFWLAAGSKK